MADFEWVWATSHRVPNLLEAGARRYGKSIAGNGQRFWVGYAGDAPIATSASYVSDGLNLIRAITTLDDYQRRGIGRAMSLCAMAASDVPRYLSSHPRAKALYKDMGFTPIATFQYWMWNPRRTHPPG